MPDVEPSPLMDPADLPQEPMARLLAVMARLRDPDRGCPWDIRQNFASIAPYTIEEAYEVADAIQRGDMMDLADELGDLLLQVVYHARMAEEASAFDFNAVVAGIAEKMIRRHPHVFDLGPDSAPGAPAPDWERRKAEERATKATAKGREAGTLDGVVLAAPALVRAQKLQRRAARVGFDWPDTAPVFAKVEEEIAEIRAELAGGAAAAPSRLCEEVGDLLFACVNLARHLNVDAETALKKGNTKFEKRFNRMESVLRQRDRPLSDASLAEMEAEWQAAKTVGW